MKDYLLNVFMSLNTIFVMMFHPTITLYTLGVLECVEVEGALYMSRDISLECWSDQHYKYVFLYGLPCFLSWIIIYPAIILLILYKNKKNLDDKAIILKYGIYYRGFKDDYFYW